MNTLIETTESFSNHQLENDNVEHKIANAAKKPLSEVSPSLNNYSLVWFRSVLEGFMDGILILTEQGVIVDANSYGRQLCRQLIQCFSPSNKNNSSNTNKVPDAIWHFCEALMESRNLFPGHTILIEDEIFTGQSQIRIRVHWISLNDEDQPHLLVVLEDRTESLKNIAITEARKYGLTEREAQVWLLRRTNQSYKAIASELHITIDTVRKHVKSIHAKRNAFI
jgi:DNA-binding CsgD family transcriptional regulator